MPETRMIPEHTEHCLGQLSDVGRANADELTAAAQLLVDTISAGGLIFTAGAGHSLAAVLETFYRAGGLASIRPLYRPELLPLHGAAASTQTERRSGLARSTLEEAGFRGGQDVLVIFSNSGVNPYPVELATNARAAGSSVIAVTSREASAAAPKRSETTLAEQADITLDTHVPSGDASYPLDAPVTAPLSSLANVMLWNSLLVAVHRTATERNVELPWWRSANTIGGDEANAANLEHYGAQIPGLL